MVIAAAAEGFLQTHDAALGEEKKSKSALKATPAFSLCWALLKLKQTPEILQREVGEKERKKRQPAGGGKTKGKVSESKERERTGEGKHRQAGRGGGGERRLSIPLVFCHTSSAPQAEWQPCRTSPCPGKGRAVWQWRSGLFLRPAARSAGSTILYAGSWPAGEKSI